MTEIFLYHQKEIVALFWWLSKNLEFIFNVGPKLSLIFEKLLNINSSVFSHLKSKQFFCAQMTLTGDELEKAKKNFLIRRW